LQINLIWHSFGFPISKPPQELQFAFDFDLHAPFDRKIIAAALQGFGKIVLAGGEGLFFVMSVTVFGAATDDSLRGIAYRCTHESSGGIAHQT